MRRVSRRMEREHRHLIPGDRPMLNGWSEFEILAHGIYQRLRAEGVVRADGTPHPLLQELTRVRRAQAQIAAQLGLGPRARAEMRAGPGPIDMDAVYERIAKARAARGRAEEVEDVEVE